MAQATENDPPQETATEESVPIDVTVEDAGVCKKKLVITVPRDRIEAKFDERFTELEREAQVPGFRPGHAPRRLIEKRFRRPVAEEVRVALVTEAFEKAVEQEKLDVIGEPDLDPEQIELPEEGEMRFSVELEVRPEFELPDYEGIPVDVERPEITDKQVEDALERLRESHGSLEPLTKNQKAKEGDAVTADLTIEVGDEKIVDGEEMWLAVAPGSVAGVPLENLPDILKGVKAGDTREEAITISEKAEREDLRGKEARIFIAVKEIRRPKPADDETILRRTEHETLDDLKEDLRRRLQNQSESVYRERQEEAVRDWLLEKAPFELPEELAKRFADRILVRHLMDLRYRGVPANEVEKRMEEFRNAAGERAARDLKLTFILDRIAKEEKVEVTDAEVDARVRFIAAQYGRRDDRLREEMAQRGTLDSLRSQIREDKVMRLLLDKARIKGEEAEEQVSVATREKAEEDTDEKAAEEAPADEEPETT